MDTGSSLEDLFQENGEEIISNISQSIGMVLKAKSVKGKHFVEDSITAVEGEMETHFKKAVYEVLQ